MVVRIIFAGLIRGGPENWATLKNQVDAYNAEIYVGSQDIESWREFFREMGKEADFETHTCTTYTLTDTNMNTSTHRCTPNNIQQWSNLHLTYKYFESQFADDDIIIKLRNDYIVHGILPLNNISDNTIYVPAKEWHACERFNKDIMTNDQIIIGRNNTMKLYFYLPYRYMYSQEAFNPKNTHYKVCDGVIKYPEGCDGTIEHTHHLGCDGSVEHPYHISCGIERTLRDHIRREGLELETLEIDYACVMWPKPEGHIF